MKFLLGLGIGIVLGMIFAPATGEETREQLSHKVDELKQRGVEIGREQARNIGAKVVGEERFNRAVGDE